MLTLDSTYEYGGNRTILKFSALSTDVLPIYKYKDTIIPNASSVVIMDTCEIKIYDEENQIWYTM